jgi:hypothetical protein
MADEKVVQFRPGETTKPSAIELPLFGDPSQSYGTVAFLHVAGVKQDDLMRILSRNAVAAIIDLRAVPVFEWPQFRHSQLVDYLSSRKIAYVDLTVMSFKSSVPDAFLSQLASQPHRLLGKLAQALDKGMALILYDEASLTSNAMSDLRRLLAHHSSFRAEIHPSALNR